MNVIRCAFLLLLGFVGAIIWIVAANVDRIVNGGEMLGFALIVYVIYQFAKVAVAPAPEEQA